MFYDYIKSIYTTLKNYNSMKYRIPFIVKYNEHILNGYAHSIISDEHMQFGGGLDNEIKTSINNIIDNLKKLGGDTGAISGNIYKIRRMFLILIDLLNEIQTKVTSIDIETLKQQIKEMQDIVDNYTVEKNV